MKLRKHEFTTPINNEFLIHRVNEFTFLMLGETVLQVCASGGHAFAMCDEAGKSHGTTCSVLTGMPLGCDSECCSWPRGMQRWLSDLAFSDPRRREIR